MLSSRTPTLTLKESEPTLRGNQFALEQDLCNPAERWFLHQGLGVLSQGRSPQVPRYDLELNE